MITHNGDSARLNTVTATTRRRSSSLMTPASTPTTDNRNENSPIWAKTMPAMKAWCQGWPMSPKNPTLSAVLNTDTIRNNSSTVPKLDQI